jgi:hypothetical protein
MTNETQPLEAAATPWDVAAVYAVSLGLFGPGALMAFRQRLTVQPETNQAPSQNATHPTR